MFERPIRYIEKQRSRFYLSVLIPALLFLAACGTPVVHSSDSALIIAFPTSTPAACAGTVPDTIIKLGHEFKVEVLDGDPIWTNDPERTLEEIHKCPLSIIAPEILDDQPWNAKTPYSYSVIITLQQPDR